MPQINPVVMEFTGKDTEGRIKKAYFIGATLEDILKYTNGGKSSGWTEYFSHRPLDPKEVEKLNLQNLRLYGIAYQAIIKGGRPWYLETRAV